VASLLCISADPEVSRKLEAMAKRHDVRYRVVATTESAEEWLSMQQFDILLIDSSGNSPKAIVQTLSSAWNHNPTMHGGVLSLSKPFSDAFDVVLIGGLVFEEERHLESFFTSLPTNLSLGETSFYGILVVEDLDSPRDIICAYIEALGYPVVRGTASVDEAIAELEANPYEYFCIVSDLQMPKKSGIDLIEFIRAHSLLRGLPIVVLTSTPSTENLIACIRAGASGFLAKPPKKLHLQKELERCKRIIRAEASPRLCEPEDAEAVDAQLRRIHLL